MFRNSWASLRRPTTRSSPSISTAASLRRRKAVPSLSPFRRHGARLCWKGSTRSARPCITKQRSQHSRHATARRGSGSIVASAVSSRKRGAEMIGHKSLRQVAAEERPLVTPVAHDALTARLIARAGFKAIAIGGSSMLAARYGLPDLGLAALGEMVDGAREIVAATDLPCIIDADDGYGDVKSVRRTMELYQRLGVAGIILEDHARDTKQPGDAKARGPV